MKTKEETKHEIRELRRRGLKQGEHFSVDRGKIYHYDIPCSKMDKASSLRWEGVPIEEIAEIINEKVEDIKRWFDR